MHFGRQVFIGPFYCIIRLYLLLQSISIYHSFILVRWDPLSQSVNLLSRAVAGWLRTNCMLMFSWPIRSSDTFFPLQAVVLKDATLLSRVLPSPGTHSSLSRQWSWRIIRSSHTFFPLQAVVLKDALWLPLLFRHHLSSDLTPAQ